ncbi:MAG: (2Fe-2S)-binding protein [Planctomycetota bacterium]
MRIDRCICTQRTFCDLIDTARAEGLSLPQLVEQTGASACCTMCGPYLRRSFRTGQTVFTCLLAEHDEPRASSADQVAHVPATPV